ncbi:bactofilin family protein [Halorubrum sp. DTA98]|uniref:bactofilin family protein n=1 Tax=Halorubrum sp. DTA98 TaxID=3402163 RepID=UPI003AB056EF
MVSPPRRQAHRIAALVLVAVVALPLVTGVGAAQSVQGASGAIVVEDGQTVDGIDGVAGTIVVRGTVAGDLSGAAGSIRIAETGRVDGTVEGAAGTVIVDGTVEGDVRVGAGSFELTDTGHIGGSLVVGAGAVTIDGVVGGDVRAAGESVVLGPNADVGGEFRYDARELTRSPDASVAGGVVADSDLRGGTGLGFGTDVIPWWLGTVYALAANLVLGGFLIAVFPRFSRDVATRVRADPLVSGGVGFATLIGVPIALALVAVTIVGIPLALAGIVAYVAALWIASVYGKYAVGTWALGLAGWENRWVALVVGLVGFTLLGLVPFLGGVLEFLALLLGLGAFGIGLYDRYRRRPTRKDSPVGESV